ncbi:hypothetical protein [Actinophytocola sp.]|uniref:hypothetical protein n=1 Tax=Actinophytocola sp. TaxID=1872138 RepID=UPI002D608A4F|nr:hypothetical protein [Actinophytocola sp.]HYQ63435.1 hypothetical protein [Actinophytocola sp.]
MRALIPNGTGDPVPAPTTATPIMDASGRRSEWSAKTVVTMAANLHAVATALTRQPIPA